MSLYITSLNSGSNGNCYYVGYEGGAILVDAGISCRETEKRMGRLGLSMLNVKAIFVSHEHGDRITGIPGISKKYQIPVYITAGTLGNGRLPIEPHLVFSFAADVPVVIDGFTITAFKKHHDAADPHSFSITANKITIGIFTDIGIACNNLNNHFKQCHAAFLESNYDEEMLSNGNYPYHLKRRITSGKGHLSNAQALAVFMEHRPSCMSHLILSHLSKHNNRPELVQALFEAQAKDTKITVASRYEESPLFLIEYKENIELPVIQGVSVNFRKKAFAKASNNQLSLF